MFAEAWILSGLLVGAICLVSFYSWRQKRRLRNATQGNYRWKPDQDYDVIQEGEANMTPAFPKLIKRQKSSNRPDGAKD